MSKFKSIEEFQKKYPKKEERERILVTMSDEEIDILIKSHSSIYAKIYYSNFKSNKIKLKSNEIVFRGHPDKVCDQISDALVDEYLSKDKNSRCGIEVMGGKGIIFITGEVSSRAVIDYEKIVKRVLSDIGYSTNYKIINNVGEQSSDIALGVDKKGAGDQGIMFGYACSDTKDYLPIGMVILKQFSMEYDKLRKKDKRFLPDGKAQITGYYIHDKLVRIKYFTISYNNTEEERDKTDNIIKELALKICNKYKTEVDEFLINPTGKFLIGGFEGDSGLTGRKLAVDTYQTFANIGGGALSGKDLTKVDRSGTYKARDIAVKYLKKHNLNWCLVEFSYAIGIEEALSININSDKGYIKVDKKLYEECKTENLIKEYSNLIFEETAKFGHF